MHSFKSFTLLNENRIQFLKRQASEYDEKNKGSGKTFLSTEHDSHAKHKTSDAIIDHFANNADPSPKKEHTQWILGQYRKGHVRQEDAGRIHQTLTDFNTYKGRLDVKDINKYGHIADLETAIEPHLGKHASKGAEERAIKHEGADLVHEEPGLTMHHIKTKEAACYYGKGTKWCTAADKNNMFDHYNNEGNLYILHSAKHGKFQFHRESNQFMDDKDREIKEDKFKEMMNDHPGLKTRQEMHPFVVQYQPEEIDKLIDGHKDYFPHLHK